MGAGLVSATQPDGDPMDIHLTTPALLFPTVSLLMLADTNRFLTLANLIHDLHAKYKVSRDPIIIAQIARRYNSS
jgi:hypothetical protein